MNGNPSFVRVAPGLWVNPEDVSALQDRSLGGRHQAHIILRNGKAIAVKSLTAQDIVDRLASASRTVNAARRK